MLSVLITIILTTVAHAQDDIFYCENGRVVTVSGRASGEIITRRAGAAYYEDNQRCSWLLQAESAPINLVFHLTVEKSDLQWAPANAICNGYDYITVYDGDTPSDEAALVIWCGESHPYSVTSTSGSVLIQFVSNDRNQYKESGAHLKFEVFERKLTIGSCPMGWVDNPSLQHGGEYCYAIKTHQETWTQAQTYCNYDQANLISITSKQENQFVTDLIKKSTEIGKDDHVWISLNDIAVDGQYIWLDGSIISFSAWPTSNHIPQSYDNCVQVNKEGYWREDFCNENDIQSLIKHMFFCKKKKVGSTELFAIPNERNTKGGETTVKSERTWMIIGVIAACVIMLIIIITVSICCCKKNGKGQKYRNTRGDGSSEDDGLALSQRHLPAAQIDSQLEPSAPLPSEPITMPPSFTAQPQSSQIVIVIQQNTVPEEPPPSYEESRTHKVLT